MTVIFVSAFTNAALDALEAKLYRVKDSYESVPNLDLAWMKTVAIERVTDGSNHKYTATGRRVLVLIGTM